MNQGRFLVAPSIRKVDNAGTRRKFMPTQQLDAGATTLLQLLTRKMEFISPLFQRRYVWDTKELDALWQDIDSLVDGVAGNRFLGALVFEVKSAGVSFKPDSLWIIDGQQRLTTLFLVLLRIAVEAEAASQNQIAAQLYSLYLLNVHQTSPTEIAYTAKLRPTLLDHEQFRQILMEIDSYKPQLPNPFGDAAGKLTSAWKSIKKEVRARCGHGKSFSAEQAQILASAILEKLKFVEIMLGEEDPHQVFDSLNSKGKALENKDLIRNLVFSKLSERPSEAERIYDASWMPLERQLGDQFDGYFFPFGLIHKSSITNSSLLSYLREKWSASEAEDIIADIKSYIPEYLALDSDDEAHRDIYSGHPELLEAIQRLHRMHVPTAFYPYMMRVLHEFIAGNLDIKDAIGNAKLIEAFLVRRAFAGLDPTGLHTVFKDFWNVTQGSSKKFIEHFDQGGSVQFPTDNEFSDGVHVRDIYNRKLRHYILSEYERGLQGGDPYPGIEPTIDHVLPRKYSQAWGHIFTEEDHKRLSNTWANLVPLSGPANAEKGNRSWEEARSIFRTETVFKTTKRLAEQYMEWNVQSIEARADQLALWALGRWPRNPEP